MDRQFLERAIKLAEEKSTDEQHGPFGAVIVKGDQIIAEGWNQVVAAHDPSAHAEITAIRAACHKLGSHELRGCTIYSSCEPCPMCLAAIYWARLDRVVFAATREDAAAAGFDDELLYDELSRAWNDRKVASEQALCAEGRRVFEKWRANPRRIAY
jgi:guanine deaminase